MLICERRAGAEPLAARYLLEAIIGLDGMLDPFNIEQAIHQN
jgi:hypothetical protein